MQLVNISVQKVYRRFSLQPGYLFRRPGRSRMLDTEYVCTLKARDLKKAKDELNEDPKQRLGAVQSLREWVQREPWINAPTDTRFSLPFLRWAKFSQLDARERLTNFCESLTDPRTYGVLKGHDPGDQQSLEIFRHGVYAMLPGTDKNGNAVLFGRPGDIENFCLEDYQKAIAPLIHSALFFSEEMQVNGLITTIDFQGVSMKHIPWAISPCRIQSVISFNTGAVFETAYSIVSPFLNEKVRNRMQVHHNLVKMYDMVDMSILPSEYLPDDYDGPTAGSVDDIIDRGTDEIDTLMEGTNGLERHDDAKTLVSQLDQNYLFSYTQYPLP